ncbi:MAG: hypothetical protein ABIF08_03000 [Nanoarchaeota archaeon]
MRYFFIIVSFIFLVVVSGCTTEPSGTEKLWGIGSLKSAENSGYWYCLDSKHLTNEITTIECIYECKTVEGRDRCIEPDIPPVGNPCVYECVADNWISVTCNGKTENYYCKGGCELTSDGTTMCWCADDPDCANPDTDAMKPVGNNECPKTKTTNWNKRCLPLPDPNSGSAAGENPDGSGFWLNCIEPITLAQAHNRGECKDINTVDPACDDWEGCNARVCREGECDEAFIPCTTTTSYTYNNGNCVPQTTVVCEKDCNCYETNEYIECPSEDCENECPFISAPDPNTGTSTVDVMEAN